MISLSAELQIYNLHDNESALVCYFVFDEVLACTYVLCCLKTNDTYGKELINYVDSINYLHMGGQATNTDNSKQ